MTECLLENLVQGPIADPSMNAEISGTSCTVLTALPLASSSGSLSHENSSHHHIHLPQTKLNPPASNLHALVCEQLSEIQFSACQLFKCHF